MDFIGTWTHTAHAPVATFERIQQGNFVVLDAMERQIGHVAVIRGFGHYTGTKGSVHEGVYAVVALVAGEMGRIEEALKVGLRNGRRDDQSS